MNDLVHVIDSDDQVKILRNDRFSRPMIHGYAPDGAPGNVRFFQTIH